MHFLFNEYLKHTPHYLCLSFLTTNILNVQEDNYDNDQRVEY